MGMSGKEESTSFHVLGLGPCSAIAVQSWGGVKFILFADAEFAKAIPSLPTMISMMSLMVHGNGWLHLLLGSFSSAKFDTVPDYFPPPDGWGNGKSLMVSDDFVC